MIRVLLITVSSAVYTMIMLMALALCATTFDITELRAAALALPAFVVIEWFRSDEKAIYSTRLWKLGGSIVSVLFVVTFGAFVWVWSSGRFSTLQLSKLKSISEYEDVEGRRHRIEVPWKWDSPFVSNERPLPLTFEEWNQSFQEKTPSMESIRSYIFTSFGHKVAKTPVASQYGQFPTQRQWDEAWGLHSLNTNAMAGGQDPCLYSEVNCNGTIVEVTTCCEGMTQQECLRQHAYDVEHACDE